MCKIDCSEAIADGCSKRWTVKDKGTPRSCPATKTLLRTLTLHVCAWTDHQFFRKVCLLQFTYPKPVYQQLSSSHCHGHDHPIPGSYSYNTTSYPCSSKCSSRALLSLLPSAAPVFSPKKFSSELKTKAKVIFTLPIELISGETGTSELRLGRMRVLEIEITRG